MSSKQLDTGVWSSEEVRTKDKNVNILNIKTGFKTKNLNKITKGRSIILKKMTWHSNTPTLTDEFQLMNTERMVKLENHHL